MRLTREAMRNILADELQKSAANGAELPPNIATLIAELREGKHGVGIESALRAMERVAEEASK
jgi:hypothetical protein